MPSFLPHVTLSVLSIKKEERSLLDRYKHRVRDRQSLDRLRAGGVRLTAGRQERMEDLEELRAWLIK